MLANALTTLAQQSGLEILERCDLAGRAATCREAPQDLYPTLRALLRQRYREPGGGFPPCP